MGQAIGQVLGFAAGVAISPIPVIALILMLFSQRARSNSLAFLVGWLCGLTGAAALVLIIGVDDSGSPSDASGWIKVVIGTVFLVLAAKQWRGRPRGDEEPQMPTWMASVDQFSAAKAFGLAVVLSAVNPKNLGLTVAAAAAIGGAGLDTGEEAVVVAVYVLLASVTLIVPVVGYFVARQQMTPVLDEMKQWLQTNNATVMTVLFAVLGAKVLGDGIAILTG